MSTTHIVVGMASALAICRPASVEALLPVIAGASVGSIICDIDCRSKGRNLKDALIGRLIVAVLLVTVLVIDYEIGQPVMNYVENLTPGFLIALFVFLVCGGVSYISGHRGFSHSLAALAIYSTCLYVMTGLMAIPFSVAYVSHVILDLLNRKPVRVLWPVKRGWCMKLFYADRKANTIFLIAGAAWLGVELMRWIPITIGRVI